VAGQHFGAQAEEAIDRLRAQWESANVTEFDEAIERMGFAPSAIRRSVEGDSGRL
jgi:hypothetical protein